MPAAPRNTVFDPNVVGIYHCYNKIVLGLFLMGQDSRWGQDCHHRRGWFLRELRLMACAMAFDILDFALMENHFHLIVRVRPDILAGWSDLEVCRRWNIICPQVFDDDGNPTEPTERQLRLWALDTDRVAELRRRLGDLSWLMGLIQQRVARRANIEQNTTGSHFWAGRFKAKRIEDEAGLLACSMYVNLNPLRAGMTESIEDPSDTSFYQRIQASWDGAQQEIYGDSAPKLPNENSSESESRNGRTTSLESSSADWLAELFLDERAVAYTSVTPFSNASTSENGSPVAADRAPDGALPPTARVSNKGYLPLKVPEYRELMQWTIARIHCDTLPITDAARDLLQRVGSDADTWISAIRQAIAKFDRYLGRVRRPVARVTN